MFKTIKSKIIASYFIPIVITFSVSLWAIYNFYALDKNVSNILTKNYNNVISVEGLIESLEKQNGAQLFIMNKQTQQGVKLFNEYKKTFNEVYGNLKNSGELDEREQTLLDTINIYYDFYLSANDTVIHKVLQNKIQQAQSFYLSTIWQVFQILREKCFILLEKNQSDMMEARSIIHNKTVGATLAVIIASILALTIGISVGWIFSQYLVRPIEKLTDLILQIRGGKLDFNIETATEDEMGELIEEFKLMMIRLQRYENLNIDRIIAEKKKSESIVESISEAIIVTDNNNRIILINEQAENIFNVKEKDALGKYFFEVVTDSRIIGWILEVVMARKPLSIDANPYLLYEIEDKKRYFRPRLTPMVTESNELLGVVTILQDVTMFKELDRLKSDFMATVSHEFNTPLTSINMSIDILNQEILGSLNDKQRELINSTAEDLMRLRKMVRELLELSRLESGTAEVKKEPINITDVIARTIRSLQLPFQNKGVNLIINVKPDLPEFNGNRDQIETVLNNLINNALKYTCPGGSVTLTASKAGDKINISIADTGRGIRKENIDSIFNKFVQFKEAIDSTPGSVGLGLAISKEIIESYGGNIWVQSEVGIGSIFTFTIPIK